MNVPREFSVAGLVVGSLLAVLGAGCFASSEHGIASPDPAERRQAMILAANAKDRSAVPDLIARLDSDDPGERFLAIGALERITGQTLGYDYAGSRKERARAVGEWVKWWKAGGTPTPASGAPGMATGPGSGSGSGPGSSEGAGAAGTTGIGR